MQQGNTPRLKTGQLQEILTKLVQKQGRKCAVCQKPFTSWDWPVLDHDHDTGVIRGALHNSCNGAEGSVKKLGHKSHKGVTSGEFVIGLGKYLEHHKTPQVPYLHPTHLTEDEKREQRNKKAREARARKKAKK